MGPWVTGVTSNLETEPLIKNLRSTHLPIILLLLVIGLYLRGFSELYWCCTSLCHLNQSKYRYLSSSGSFLSNWGEGGDEQWDGCRLLRRSNCHVCMYVYICIYEYMSMYIFVYVYIYIYLCACLCMYVCMCTYVCLCVFMCVYVYAYMGVLYVCLYTYLIIRKSDLADKMKRSFFQAAVVSIVLYGCTTWTLTKRLEKKLDGNYTRMLRAILNKSWRQHPTRYQLYGHLPPITKTIKVRILQEKQGRAHKWCTPMDPRIWPSKSKTTSTNIHSAAMWGYGMWPWRLARGDERKGKVAREAKGYPCLWHDLMMMMIYISSYVFCLYMHVYICVRMCIHTCVLWCMQVYMCKRACERACWCGGEHLKKKWINKINDVAREKH